MTWLAMNKNKERFLRAYSDLPEKIRGEIIVIVNENPFTWNSAYLEIKNDTEIGKQILNNMKELGII